MGASLASYTFLKSAPVEKELEHVSGSHFSHPDPIEGNEESKVFLPEVLVVKKMLDLTKDILRSKD